MRIDVLTIFPGLFTPFLEESFLRKAGESGVLDIQVHDLRNWATDRHRTVDDRPFGGGIGMVMMIDPVWRAVQSLRIPGKNVRIVLFTPRGRRFTQGKAGEYAEMDQLILICGRYEGVDERIATHIADERISLGPFVLMGGEVPALAVIESVSRLLPGVIGKSAFLQERAPDRGEAVEYPQYTRPDIYCPEPGVSWKVPSVLLSGDHKKIGEWRKKKGKVIGKKAEI